METLARPKIRQAEAPPVACASCYGQYPDRRHVDFSAAYDGPVLNVDEVVATGVAPMQIDDLVICEECLTAAAAALELGSTEGERIAKLEERVKELTEVNRGLKLYENKLEAALAAKPSPGRKSNAR